MNSSSSRVYLMYHEIELPGRPMCQQEPGYVRYVVTESDFRRQMRFLKESGRRGVDVSEALTTNDPAAIAITLDDACETDLIAVAPLLRELQFNATCYATVGFLGRPGYLSRPQLRELSDLGLEIGSHSMTHPYLTDSTAEELRYEIFGSKQELEQITGRAIWHFSCPGGRWDSRVARAARDAGYRSVTTSHVTANSLGADPFALGRVAILRGTDMPTFQSFTQGRGFWRIRLKHSLPSSFRRVLGNAAYDRVRDRLLGRTPRD